MIEARTYAPPPIAFEPLQSPLRWADACPWASEFLSHEERRALDEAGSASRPVKAGTDLVPEGERSDGLFIITQGWACRYATTKDGGRQLSALLVPGDIGNLDSLMFGRLDYGVRTLCEATVVELPRARALALATRYPAIARAFTRLAMVENMILSRWLLLLGRVPAKNRLAHLLCELSVRSGTTEDDETGFEFPLTQEQLADVLGLTAVHVNRTLQQLRADGLITNKGRRMIIPDLARLGRLAGFSPSYLHADPLSVIGSA